MSRLFGPFSKGRKESPERKTATASTAPSVPKPASSAASNQVEWSIETLDGVPDGLPFTNGRGYLRFHRIDPSLKGGEVDALYADSEAVKALTCIVAAAEDEQALLARDNGLPRLATYFDNLWGLNPGDMQVVYWRARTMYDVRFAPLDGKFAPTSIIRASGDARETVWSVKKG